VTGDAGAFLDPLFSPGSNYISYSNTFISDLIVRDLDGEDIGTRADHHNDLYLSMYEAELGFYTDFYAQMGNAQVAAGKITLGTILYWAFGGVLFHHDKLTDLEFMSSVRPDVKRGVELIGRMEELWEQWHELDRTEYRDGWVNMVAPTVDAVLYLGLYAGHDDATLEKQVKENLALMEAAAVTFFHKGTALLPDARVAEDQKINPYAVSLQPERWESDGLFDDSGVSLLDVREKMQGIEAVFLDHVAEPAEV
jgi:hypothetical protein